MRFRRVLALLLIFGCGSVLRAEPQFQKRPIRDLEITAVIQAIEDEIYDLNLQMEFLDVRSAKDSRETATLNVYFQPEVLDDSHS